jgi:serine/threonine-protein kinase
MVHRDVKPSNMLLTEDRKIKLLDLGLGVLTEADDSATFATADGVAVGTVDYMSPEQARDSRATSERSDIYSLGCTFYFLLTGSPPYPGGDVADKLSRHCLQPPPDPRELRPEIPAPLALLIQRMMAKRPENRFDGYDDLLDELDAVPTAEEKAADEPLFALFDEDDDEGPCGRGHDSRGRASAPVRPVR